MKDDLGSASTKQQREKAREYSEQVDTYYWRVYENELWETDYTSGTIKIRMMMIIISVIMIAVTFSAGPQNIEIFKVSVNPILARTLLLVGLSLSFWLWIARAKPEVDRLKYLILRKWLDSVSSIKREIRHSNAKHSSSPDQMEDYFAYLVERSRELDPYKGDETEQEIRTLLKELREQSAELSDSFNKVLQFRIKREFFVPAFIGAAGIITGLNGLLYNLHEI